MIDPDFRIVDRLTEELKGGINDPDQAVNAGTTLAIMRVALRLSVHFLGRDIAAEVLRKEALDVGIATGSAPQTGPVPEKPRNQRDEDFAEELLATGFWGLCIGAGALVGFILARALP